MTELEGSRVAQGSLTAASRRRRLLTGVAVAEFGYDRHPITG